MSIALSGAARSIAVPEWRELRSDRRAMIRSIVLTVLGRGLGELEPTLEEVKHALAYYSLSDKDRGIVRTMFTDIRIIARGWGNLSPREQESFRQGRLTPSSLAARMRSRSPSADNLQGGA